MNAPRTSIWCSLAGLLFVCGAAHAAAPGELRPFSATFSFKYGGFTAGTAELRLQRVADNSWSYQQHVQARGLAVFARSFLPAENSHSLFSLQNGRVVPRQYTAEDGPSSKDKDQLLDFDWARGRVTGFFENKPIDLPTQPGLLDSLTVQVALMNELVAGRTPQRYLELDETVVKEYIYTTEGTVTLRTAVGEHRTLIYRSTRPGSKKSTWFWCAPELGYLPLKVERRDGKDVKWSMAVKAIDIDSKP